MSNWSDGTAGSWTGGTPTMCSTISSVAWTRSVSHVSAWSATSRPIVDLLDPERALGHAPH
jgi:hypothetical protein